MWCVALLFHSILTLVLSLPSLLHVMAQFSLDSVRRFMPLYTYFVRVHVCLPAALECGALSEIGTCLVVWCGVAVVLGRCVGGRHFGCRVGGEAKAARREGAAAAAAPAPAPTAGT
jgi:hypothetical protein